MTIKLAIFDWAGTTVDYGCCAPAAVFVEGFRQRGVTVSLAQAREPMGMEKRAHIATMSAMPAIAEEWQRVHQRPINDQDIDAMYQAFVPLLLKVLGDYSMLIPGTLETMQTLRRQGIKIGSNTGYFEEATRVVCEAATKQGYTPDFTICATQVPVGRPAPWMLLRTMEALNVYPPQAVVAIGDTRPDIEAGLNAGMWTIGFAKTGNEVGLTEAEIKALSATEVQARVERARQRLAQAGAHYVVDGIAEVPGIIEEINHRLAQGEKP